MISWLQRWLSRPRDSSLSQPSYDDIGADTPIKSADQDRLRRATFAGRIADILAGPCLEEGRVFAIRGAWGQGKSSLKNMIIEQLGKKREPITLLEFNPWQWGEQDEISRALFQQIADKLGGPFSSEASKRAEKFRRYGAILNGAKQPLEAAAGKSQAITSVLTSASLIALAGTLGFKLPSTETILTLLLVLATCVPLLGKALMSLGQDRWSAALDEVRSDLENSLRKLERPLVVFVDDIDRLEHNQIRMLFRHIKANANLPNVVFVLLYQPSIVEAALDPIASNNGRAFLEKIVQANFDLPSVPKAMVHRVLTEGMTQIANDLATAENGFTEVRWGNALVGGIQPFITNLRDARRYLSSVAVHLPLHTGDTVFEVNIVDFLTLEALRVFEPEVHGTLFGESDLLLQTTRAAGDRKSEEHKKRLSALIDRAPETRREPVQDILTDLFPQIAWAFGGSHYSMGSWAEAWLKDKRVCSSTYFSRYFELQTPEGEISESEFRSFLAVTNDREQLDLHISALCERGLDGALAERLDQFVDVLPTENASVLLPAMFFFAQSLVTSKHADPFSSSWVSAWRATSWYVRNLPDADRELLVIEAFKQSKALSVANILIHLNSADPESEERSLEPCLSGETLSRLKEEWLKQLASLEAEGILLQQPDIVSYLFRWRDYSGSATAAKAWIAKISSSETGFIELVERLASTVRTHTMGDKVSSTHETFDKSTIETFIGLEEAKRKLAAIDASQLQPAQAALINTLSRQVEEWCEPKI